MNISGMDLQCMGREDQAHLQIQASILLDCIDFCDFVHQNVLSTEKLEAYSKETEARAIAFLLEKVGCPSEPKGVATQTASP
jgi:hypothetical protein